MKKSTRSSRVTQGAVLLLGFACTGSLLAAAQVPPAALTGGQEVPAVETTATASSTIEVGSDMSVKGNVETAGIEGTMAHIHMAPTGTNGPPIVTLEKRGEHSWVVPAGTHLTAEQYAKYKLGGLYVNVHSAAHANGELRLQLAGR
jgi:hypothetical protein